MPEHFTLQMVPTVKLESDNSFITFEKLNLESLKNQHYLHESKVPGKTG